VIVGAMRKVDRFRNQYPGSGSSRFDRAPQMCGHANYTARLAHVELVDGEAMPPNSPCALRGATLPALCCCRAPKHPTLNSPKRDTGCYSLDIIIGPSNDTNGLPLLYHRRLYKSLDQ
jgi:hypothetical protein